MFNAITLLNLISQANAALNIQLSKNDKLKKQQFNM